MSASPEGRELQDELRRWLFKPTGRRDPESVEMLDNLPERLERLLRRVGDECFDEGSAAEASEELVAEQWKDERDARVRDAILNQLAALKDENDGD